MPVTILHLNTETSWRGGEAQTLRLAIGLRDRGHTCLVAAPPGSPLLERSAAAGLEALPFRARGELDLSAAGRLARLLVERRVGLLHDHTAHAVTLGTLASLFGGRRPVVATRRVSFPLRGRLLGRLKYSVRIDRLIAVSEAIRARLIADGLDPDRIVTVHSGIDPDRFTRGDRSRFRAGLGGAPGFEQGFLVGTAGHLAAHKGIDLFLDAAALAARERPELRFVIIGRGEEEARLRKQAVRLGLSERVLFAGFREDMPDVYAGLDLFVLASLSGEGSPAVVKEAMAAGVALAATDLEGLEEIVEDGRHGLLTPPGNAPALARAIVLLASDPSLRERMALAARDRVREFTSDRMVERTERVYHSVVGMA